MLQKRLAWKLFALKRDRCSISPQLPQLSSPHGKNDVRARRCSCSSFPRTAPVTATDMHAVVSRCGTGAAAPEVGQELFGGSGCGGTKKWAGMGNRRMRCQWRAQGVSRALAQTWGACWRPLAYPKIAIRDSDPLSLKRACANPQTAPRNTGGVSSAKGSDHAPRGLAAVLPPRLRVRAARHAAVSGSRRSSAAPRRGPTREVSNLGGTSSHRSPARTGSDPAEAAPEPCRGFGPPPAPSRPQPTHGLA